MTHVLKESTIGQIIYRASGRRVFSYPEERDGFVIPDKYKPGYADEKKQSRQRRFSADELNGNGDGDSGNNEATREGVERRVTRLSLGKSRAEILGLAIISMGRRNPNLGSRAVVPRLKKSGRQNRLVSAERSVKRRKKSRVMSRRMELS